MRTPVAPPPSEISHDLQVRSLPPLPTRGIGSRRRHGRGPSTGRLGVASSGPIHSSCRSKGESMRGKKLLKAALASVALSVAALAGTARAGDLVLDLGTSINGAAPSTAPPWVTLDFQTVG